MSPIEDFLSIQKEKFDNYFSFKEYKIKTNPLQNIKMKYYGFSSSFNHEMLDKEIDEYAYRFIEFWAEHIKGKIAAFKSISNNGIINELIHIHVSFLNDLNQLKSKTIKKTIAKKPKENTSKNSLGLNPTVIITRLLNDKGYVRPNVSNKELSHLVCDLSGYSENTIRQKLSDPIESFSANDLSSAKTFLRSLSEEIPS